MRRRRRRPATAASMPAPSARRARSARPDRAARRGRHGAPRPRPTPRATAAGLRWQRSQPHAEPEAVLDRLLQPARHERVARAVQLVDHPLELVQQLVRRRGRGGEDDAVGADLALAALGVADGGAFVVDRDQLRAGQAGDAEFLDPGRMPPLERRLHIPGDALGGFDDGDLGALVLAQRFGEREPDLAAADDDHAPARLHPAVGDVERIEHALGARQVRIACAVGVRAGGDDAHVVLVRHAAHELGVDLGVQPHLDAELLRDHLVVRHHRQQVVGAREVVLCERAQVAADAVGLVEHRHLMAAPGRGDRALHPGRTGADHHDLLLHRRGRHLVLGLDLVAECRVDRAGVGQVAEQPRQAVERPDAAPHLVEPVLGRLVDQLGVGEQRAAHFPEVEHAVAHALVGHARVGQPVAEGDQRVREHLLRALGQIVPVPRGDVAADRRLGRLLPADGDADHVDAHIDRLLHQLEALVLGVAAPLVHQLGAVQAHDQRMVGRGLLDAVDQLAHEAAAVRDRAAVLVAALVGEARIEVREQITHEARDLGAVEAGADRALGGIRMLRDAVADLVLGHHLGRAEVRQRLRHVRRLDAVAQVDAAVASGVQDLLDRDRTVGLDVGGDALELRHELVVVDRELAEVPLAFAQRVGVGALVGDDAAAGARDHLHARDLALGDEAVAGVVVRDAAGAVLAAVGDREPPELAGLEQVRELGFAGFHRAGSLGGGEWQRARGSYPARPPSPPTRARVYPRIACAARVRTMRLRTLLSTMVWLLMAAPVLGAIHLDRLALPPGFEIAVYADQVPDARELARGAKGTVFVGSMGAGKVYALTDTRHQGRADRVRVIASGLEMPVGVAFRDGDLYISAVSRIWRLRDIENHLDDPPPLALVTDKLPRDRHHGWRFIAFGPDGKLYVPIGAPCNVCDRGRDYAKLTRMNPDGRDRKS